jgi:hypothetical protein
MGVLTVNEMGQGVESEIMDAHPAQAGSSKRSMRTINKAGTTVFFVFILTVRQTV